MRMPDSRRRSRRCCPGANWQRCRTHFMRDLLCRVPKSAQGLVATLARLIFAQPDAASTWTQQARVVDQLAERFPAAAELLSSGAALHGRRVANQDPHQGNRRRRRSSAAGGGTTGRGRLSPAITSASTGPDQAVIPGLELCVDLVGSRRIWPARLGRVVGPDGLRRIASDRPDNQAEFGSIKLRACASRRSWATAWAAVPAIVGPGAAD
jgi:hypothetical protein